MARKKGRDDRTAAIGTCAKKKKKDEIVKVPPETTWNIIFTHQSQQCSYNAGNGAYYISTLMAFSIDFFHNDVKGRKTKLTWNLIGSTYFASQSNFM